MNKNNLLRIMLATALVLAVAALLLNWNTNRDQNVPATQKMGTTRTPQRYCRDFSQAVLEVAGATINVAVAQTREEHVRGLSGCAHIPPDSGMYFSYDAPKNVAFWMKDMLVPLDIIWIADGNVVGAERDVPAPDPGTPDNALPQYLPPQPITGVLELPAGSSERYGIIIGSKVSLVDSSS